MAADMSVQSLPVGEQLGFLGQSGLLEERCQKTVGVILQKDFCVKVHGMLERSVKQLYLV